MKNLILRGLFLVLIGYGIGVLTGLYAIKNKPDVPEKARTIKIEYETHLTEKAQFPVTEGTCLLVEQEKDRVSISLFRDKFDAIAKMNKAENYRRQLRQDPRYIQKNGFVGLFTLQPVPLESKTVSLTYETIEHQIKAQ